MKLSEAIRLSGMTDSQIRYKFYDQDGGTCAMGGAYKAIGKNLGDIDACSGYTTTLALLAAEFPILALEMPVYGDKHGGTCSWGKAESLYTSIAHMNDCLQMTRQQIADWVEGIENKLDMEKKEQDTKALEPVEQPKQVIS